MKSNGNEQDKERFEILLEHMEDKIDRIAEATGGIADDVRHLRQRVDVIEANTSNYPVAEIVVTEHSSKLQNHEKRINKLEKQVA